MSEGSIDSIVWRNPLASPDAFNYHIMYQDKTTASKWEIACQQETSQRLLRSIFRREKKIQGGKIFN